MDKKQTNDLESCSGLWVGFWVQHQHKGHMELELHFEGGAIQGGGHDRVGSFSILKGSYTLDGQVSFVKRYATHPIHYSGKWDGEQITGTWKVAYLDSGPFEIWPVKHGASMEMLSLQEVAPSGSR